MAVFTSVSTWMNCRASQATLSIPFFAINLVERIALSSKRALNIPEIDVGVVASPVKSRSGSQ